MGPRFMTSPIVQGDLHVTVTATGTLSARDSVPVGAEISGRVTKVHVDFNDKVKTGQLLVEIDPEQYRAKRDDAMAQLLLAKASLITARTTARESELKAKRLRSMQDAGLASMQDLEAAEAAYDRATAAVASSEAQINSAGASLKVATSSLGKTTIRSPIDGIVLERSVEPGQAINAGMTTPVVFTLAADLSEMRLAIKVDEADVGQVHAGQQATFTVDAYPNRTFQSTVVSVKNLPTTSQNVVTYETRLSVRNEQGLLRPGMTATATIVVEDESQVLLVPNAALRFTPKAPPQGATEPPKGFSISSILPHPPDDRKARQGTSAESGKPGKDPVIYVLRGGKPERVAVQVSATDGVYSAVTGPGLKSQIEVITGESVAGTDAH